ncbi:MAG: glycosyltransferase family 39 protein [Nitrospinota bacterium]|nr:glycosyltransferase family 39 protein [Nitrospinota bacterium]
MSAEKSLLSFIVAFFARFKLCLLLLPFFLISLNLGGGLAKLPVEIRSIKIVKEMVKTNDLLVPRIDGKPYITKPPFYHWMASFISYVFGSVNWLSIRIPSLLAAFFILFLVFKWGKELGGEELGILSLFITFSIYLFVVLARRGAPDMVFSASCFTCLYLFQRIVRTSNKKLFYCFFASFSIAFLTKAHVVFLVVVLPLLVILVLIKRLQRIFSLDVIFMSLCSLLVSISWYWMLYLWNPNEALYWLLLEGGQPFDLKIVGETAQHFKPFYYYFLRIWDLFLPFSMFLPLTFIFFWKRKKTVYYDGWLYVIYPFLIVFLLFTIIPAKQPHYILPILPLLSLMVGKVITEECVLVEKKLNRLFYWSTVSYLMILFVLLGGAIFFIFYFLENKFVPFIIIFCAVSFYILCIRLLFLNKVRFSIYLSFVVVSCFFIIFCGYFEEWKSYDRNRKRSNMVSHFGKDFLRQDLTISSIKDGEFING